MQVQDSIIYAQVIKDIIVAICMLIIPAMFLFAYYIKSRNRHQERMELIARGLVESGYDDLSVAKPPLPGGFALVSGMLMTATGLAGLISALIISLTKHPQPVKQ